jgi:hypothetical protein
VSVEHGDVVRLSGDGLVALRTDRATSVAERWAAIQIDAPTAGDRDGELPPLSWELVQRRSGASPPVFSRGLVRLKRDGARLLPFLERRPDARHIDSLVVGVRPRCDAFSSGALGFTVVCEIAARVRASSLTGASAREGVAESRVSGEPTIVLIDLAPRHDRDAGAMIAFDDAATILRADATWLTGERAPTLVLGASR